MARRTVQFNVAEASLRADLEYIATHLDIMIQHYRELEDMPAKNAQTLAVRYIRDLEGIARAARRSSTVSHRFNNTEGIAR